MLWDLFQQLQIHRATEEASEAGASARTAGRSLAEVQRTLRTLESQVERLTLAAMAMAELLRDRLGVAEEEIEAKVREIDLRDGRIDGKLAASVKRCVACGRVNGSRRSACLYCGADLPEASILFGAEESA